MKDYVLLKIILGLLLFLPEATYAIDPPIITATGNQTYCPSTSIKIVTGVTITHDPSETGTDAIYIQISSGYVSGQDLLTLANPLLHPTITTSWSTLEGKLKLSSSTGIPVTYSDFEAAIKDVTFTNSSLSPSGTRDFSINLGFGSANYLPSNGHFYEYVPSLGINWTKARDEAAAKTYYGLQGYLATLTSADEAQLAGSQAPGTGWIGGSDAETEGTWKWVTGPEAGTTFWIGKNNGTTTAPFYYANWNAPNEPNNTTNTTTKINGEDYAHITSPAVGNAGTWNDLSEVGDPPGNYYPNGYIVEYGGMPGDAPLPQISASTKITIPKITSTTPIPITICGSGSVILQATASENSNIYWFDSAKTGNLLHTGNSFTTPILATTTSYFVDVSTEDCLNRPRIEVPVTVNPLPVVKDVTIVQCDTDLIVDGKTLFNLTVNNDEISANSANEIFKYYTSLNGAENAIATDLIANELAFENTTPTLMDIWARVANKITGCYSVAKINLKVPATNINPNFKIPFPPVCDDFLDTNGNNNANNNNRDGIATFDFSSTKTILLAQLPTNQVYNITYYKNESDALAETNVINDISNYRNIGYPNSQDIWIRIDSNLDNACYGLGPYLTLKVEALPVANTVTIPRQCDDNNDGIFTFNTSSLQADLLKGQTNVTVTYFDQNNNPLKDANGVLITSPFPANFTSTSQTIKAVVTNNTPQHCYDETTIQFIVDNSPVAFPVSSSLTTACDDEANPINQDGKFGFDTSTFETTILGGQTGMVVKYYDQNNVLLPSPLPNPFLTGTQNVTAKVQNPLNTICTASTTLSFVVNPVPKININLDGNSNKLICSNISTFFVTLDAGITDNSPTTNYDYVWTKDGVNVGSNSPTLSVNAEGVYTVEVKNHLGCGRIRTIKVTASNIATLVSVDVVDLKDVNTVTVNVTGPGAYEYSLDEPSGFWQDSNFFNNVPAGIHVVYINDKNGCGSINQEIVLVGAPKFFTPNNDGFNDYWNIKGVNATYNSKSIIYIFDRYGKLLKQWIPYSSQGWDGTYNGVPLPADDYWFTLKLEDGRETKGHFSLKR
ncbi:MAG: T9SS type B sorting domain-containing protein [Flavobacterium sp.]|nr:T9SS type B sorting domain-containing protein [Flavobacterium sp.]